MDMTYLVKPITAKNMMLEYQVPKRCDDGRCPKTIQAKLPRLFPFPRPRVDARHQKDDVQRAKHIEDLEAKVPCMLPVGRRGDLEEVEVAGAEDDGIEDLGEQRYTLGAAVGVDGPYQDQLGGRV